MLAYELKLPLSEVYKMTVKEVQLWQAFFILRNEKTGEKKQNSKSGAKFTKNINIDNENALKLLMMKSK